MEPVGGAREGDVQDPEGNARACWLRVGTGAFSSGSAGSTGRLKPGGLLKVPVLERSDIFHFVSEALRKSPGKYFFAPERLTVACCEKTSRKDGVESPIRGRADIGVPLPGAIRTGLFFTRAAWRWRFSFWPCLRAAKHPSVRS